MQKLKKGEEVVIPEYTFELNQNKLDGQKFPPYKIIIVEGMFIFKPELINEMDFLIFVDVDDDVRFSRMGKLKTEINLVLRENFYLQNKAGRFKSYFYIYENYIKPSFEKFIESVFI